MKHKKISGRLLHQSQMPIKSGYAGQEIIEHILSPLKKTWTGFECLHDRAESNISHGLIRSTRDLELMLTFGADPRDSEWVDYSACSELHTSPWTRYTKYCCQVTSLCDDFMGSTQPDWRNEYFVTELDSVLKTHLSYTQRQLGNLDAFLLPDLSGNDLNSTLVDIIMAPSSHFAETGFTTDCAAVFQMNSLKIPSDDHRELPDQAYYNLLGQVDHKPTVETYQELSEQTFYEDAGNSDNETPWHTQYEPLRSSSCKLRDPTFQEPPDCSICELSSVSISPQSTNDLVPPTCKNCDKVFHSKSKDLPNNLKRHQDTVCARKIRFKCSENGCKEGFPRKDYLKAHYRKEHGHNAHAKSYKPDRRRSRRGVNSSAVLNQSTVNLSPADFF